MPTQSNGNRSSAVFDKVETRIKGKAVSRGIAFGKVICLHGRNRQFFRVDLPSEETASEIKRLRSAFRLAEKQLRELASAESGKSSISGPGIFEAQQLILDDKTLRSKIEDHVVKQCVNAEWALKCVADEYIARFHAMTSEHLRDRYIDIEDVADRILNALAGKASPKIRLGPNSIIASRDLRPSTIAGLHGKKPVALISEHGGWTSHTFILARESNIPAVTGLKHVLRRLETGDKAIVDGYNGLVIIDPSDATTEEYRLTKARSVKTASSRKLAPSKPLTTLDGREVIIRANADLPVSYSRAKTLGVKGIGLFRSESLFNRFKGFPSENQQFEAYRRLAAVAGKDRLRIRTFDIGIGQLIERQEDRERNPALGLRGVRLSLAYPKQLRVQLRAILRANTEQNIDMVIPMIAGLAEIREVRNMLNLERIDLEKKGTSVDMPGIGAMIEVPAALLVIDAILEEVDFICLGTNDLIQYLLAVDRDNENVANWYRTLHPSVIQAIRSVLTAAGQRQKPVILCGEMSGSPFYVPILVGLGATELSMNISSIERVQRIIRGIAYEEARDLAERILECKTADEVERSAIATVRSKWAHLFPDDFLIGNRF
ncbi:MAG: phosphoenolpyruvate--protein phosphotransferase [Blastocatellia bacterium]|nr:phosphoenolpyruvate--protein phosphotransferase [Blastocatellia bacterium]